MSETLAERVEGLTPQQRDMLGWIARRDEGGKGVRYLPSGAWTARVVSNLVRKGMVEIGKSKSTGKLAWRATDKGRAALAKIGG